MKMPNLRTAPRGGRLRTFLTRLIVDRNGSFAVFVAVSIIPLMAMVGLSVDSALGWLVKLKLGSAVDAAALAGGRVYASPNRDDDIRMFFEANFPNGYMNTEVEPLVIVPDDEDRTLTVTAQATMPTVFMHLVGFETITVAAETEVTLESRNLEVSLVLDVTGSMDGQRIRDLRDAANELVEIVVQDQQEPFYSKVALVPYSMAVNVGGYAEQVRGSYTNDTCRFPAEPTCRYYEFPTAEEDWRGNTIWAEDEDKHEISTCVTERTGEHAYSDVAPSVAPLGRNFPPPGSYHPCLSSEIVPLTSNKDLLHDHINDLDAEGSTSGHIGIAWGWYMLSPNFGYLWPSESQPATYEDEDQMKVAIIMTDGAFNTVYYNGVIARDSLEDGSGADRYKIDHDSHNGSAYHQAQQLCDVMKEAGILIYTVGLDIADKPEAYDIMEQCATDPSYVYFPESGTDLKDAFREIANKVSQLRLSK